MNRFARGSEQRSVEARPTTDHAEATPPPRSHTRILTVLSVVTLLWLAGQLAIAYHGGNGLYPVTNYGMFATGGDWPEVRLQLAGVDGDGTPTEIQPEDLALTRLQLNFFLTHQVGRSADGRTDAAESELEAISQIWTDRHDVELVELSLWRLEYWPGAAGEPVREEVARWER